MPLRSPSACARACEQADASNSQAAMREGVEEFALVWFLSDSMSNRPKWLSQTMLAAGDATSARHTSICCIKTPSNQTVTHSSEGEPYVFIGVVIIDVVVPLCLDVDVKETMGCQLLTEAMKRRSRRKDQRRSSFPH